MSVQPMVRAPVLAAGRQLLDRHALPRFALAFISLASFIGTLLTMTTHGAPWGLAAVRWLHLASLAALAGGTMWWGLFVRPEPEAEDDEAVARLALLEERRYRLIAAGAVAIAIVTSPHLLFFERISRFNAPARGLLSANILLLAAVVAMAALLLQTPADPGGVYARRRRVRLLWGASLALLAATALMDARLTFPTLPSASILRPLHVVAFALWMGGAIWNLFVAIPAAREEPTVPVVVAAAHQLERFRWAVRVILPTLLATGLIQALPYVGWSLSGLAETLFGRLIAVKMGLLVALFAVFITCPLWRACSPIRGMCDLKELRAARPAEPAPARRLDNRGKACAGFVHIRRALSALQPGEILELLSSDPISWWELPAWVELNGHELVRREQAGRWRLLWKSYRFLIRKGTGGSGHAERARPADGAVAGADATTAVAVLAPGDEAHSGP